MTAAGPASRVEPLERRYLSGTFAELCRIESPSGRERACAERVIAELRGLGIQVEEDDAGPLVGGDCGNLLARIPADPSRAPAGRSRAPAAASRATDPSRGTAELSRAAAEPSRAPADAQADASDLTPARPSVLLCAHLDTVPLRAPVEPVLIDGVWENANEGILGADNKAAVAVLLALARHVRREGSLVDVELLFTVGEERSLAGASAFDVARLRSDFGFVFDHPSPVGEVVVDSPTHFRVQASFHGAAAHAGINPEAGRSAILAAARAIASMRLGRLDDDSTVNLGTISGGSAINVVAEHCSVLLEARALGDERAETIVAEIVDRVHEAANLSDCDCDVDVDVRRTFSGYRLTGASPAVRVAEAALRACGHEPVRISSGGGSDANALLAQGFQMANLANATERNHEPDERVSVVALEEMLDVALALLGEAAALAPAAAL